MAQPPQTLNDGTSYYSLFNHAPIGLFRVTPEGECVEANMTLARILGFDSPQLIKGRNVQEFYRSIEDRSRLTALLEKGKSISHYEIKLRRSDKSMVWVRARAHAITDESGRITYFEGTIEDISRQKEIEEDLHRVEARYRSLVEMAPTVVYIVNLEGAISYINPRIEPMLGYPREDWLTKPGIWASRIHPEDRERILIASFQDALQTHKPLNNEYRLIARDGRTVWLHDEAVFIYDETGSPAYLQGVAVDITAQKEAETRQETLIDGLHSVLAAADELLACPCLDSLLKRAVELARDRLGIERGALFLRDDAMQGMAGTYGINRKGEVADERYVFFHDQDWAGDLRHLLSQEQMWTLYNEADLNEWDGAKVVSFSKGWVVGTPLQSSGNIIGVFYNDSALTGAPPDPLRQNILAVYCSLLGNIIERKRTLEQIERMNAELESRILGRTRQMHQANEDLKAQITERMRVEKEMEQRNRDLHDLSRHIVEIQESERRKIALELHDEVGQVLTRLKIMLQTGRSLEPGDLNSLLDEAQLLIDELIAWGRNRSLDLRPAMLDDLGLLPALLSHIKRYSEQTGISVDFQHLAIEGRFPPDAETTAYRIVQEALTNVARHSRADIVTVQIWADSETLWLIVHDHGCGFDPGSLPEGGQTGGLTGMRERVRLLGGRLTVDTSPGCGTRLTAELPLIVT